MTRPKVVTEPERSEETLTINCLSSCFMPIKESPGKFGLGQGSRFCPSVWLPPTDYTMGAVGPWIILKSSFIIILYVINNILLLIYIIKTLSLWFLK